MEQGLLSALILSLVALVGVIGLRTFSYPVRIAFDTLCFAAISLFFYILGILPLFPPLRGELNGGPLLLRVVGGAWWLLGARILVAGLWLLFAHDSRSRGARLFFDLSTGLIYLAAAGVVLNSVFALPVTGIVATSGAIAIVLGLALQNTLADVFAGIAVGIEAPFGVGDHIRIGEKAEGEVIQINWRSIRILTRDNDVAILPNSVVAKEEIVNRSFPTPRRSLSIDFEYAAGTAPERIIEKLEETVMLLPDVLAVPGPRVVLTRLGSDLHQYCVTFSIEGVDVPESVRDHFLRCARRQLLGLRFPAAMHLDAASSSAAALLRQIVLLEPLDETQIESLVQVVEFRRLDAGEALFAQGTDDPALYIIADGVVEISRRTDAGFEVLGCAGAGDYIGEIGLLTGTPHAASATARTRCTVLRLPREALAPLLASNAALAALLERAVHRGLATLERSAAARAVVGTAKGPFLARMRAYFQHDGSANV